MQLMAAPTNSRIFLFIFYLYGFIFFGRS
jgi:hypothetical protein